MNFMTCLSPKIMVKNPGWVVLGEVQDRAYRHPIGEGGP